jgi:hypothetical protein
MDNFPALAVTAVHPVLDGHLERNFHGDGA